VTVKSFNISRSQILYARWRAKAEGLDSRVEFIEDDYRNISAGSMRWCRWACWSTSAPALWGIRPDDGRCLGPTGRGLIQSIGQDQPRETNAWIQRRIFPGAYPPRSAR